MTSHTEVQRKAERLTGYILDAQVKRLDRDVLTALAESLRTAIKDDDVCPLCHGPNDHGDECVGSYR